MKESLGVIIKHVDYRRFRPFVLFDPWLKLGILTSLQTNIWGTRVESYYRLGRFTFPAVGVVYSLLRCSANMVFFRIAYEGVLRLSFPLFNFSPSHLLFLLIVFSFGPFRLFFRLFFFFSYSSFFLLLLDVPFLYPMATPSSTPSSVARWKVWDDLPFSIVQYLVVFRNRFDARRFVAM